MSNVFQRVKISINQEFLDLFDDLNIAFIRNDELFLATGEGRYIKAKRDIDTGVNKLCFKSACIHESDEYIDTTTYIEYWNATFTMVKQDRAKEKIEASVLSLLVEELDDYSRNSDTEVVRYRGGDLIESVLTKVIDSTEHAKTI